MSEKEYDFKNIEEKWQKYWMDNDHFKAVMDKNKEKFYCLCMLPYPSGKLHMGHVRNYSIGDVIARSKKMMGYNVLHPIGWDAFGLPAEQAAMKRDIHPAKWTFSNIDVMRKQLMRMGISYDWDREIATCKPDYYKWQQWMFIKLYEKGLIYKKKSPVNWSESQQTVLANEQVIDGKDYLTGEPVVTKYLDQWFFKITDYADQLIDDIKELEDGWPEKVLTMQRNWIGRSIGLSANFKLDGNNFPIFTTRPDTIYGVTYMAISPEHPLVEGIIKDAPNKSEIEAFIKEIKAESIEQRVSEEGEKKGIFTGKYVNNPFNNEQIPLYIANFVLMDYGHGAIMAVPAHDQRDFMFAKKYGVPIKVVIQNEDNSLKADEMTEAYTDEGTLINSGPFDGENSKEAINKIINYAEMEEIGKKDINYRLRDWGISRQRYWGNPIPMIYCEDCGIVPEKYENLPVELPLDVKFTKGGNPLTTSETFVNTTCPKCGKPARRETDTMDTFVCSSWYFLRYTSPKEDDAPFNKEEADYWMSVDQYIGGIEHATGHLIYARFFTKILRDLGLLSVSEPAKRLLTQGMVNKESYYSPSEKRYYFEDELDEDKTVSPNTGEKLVIKVEKMSKSKNNGIDPDKMIDRYGVDTVRLFCLFASPPEKDLEWNTDGVDGAYRFLKRVFRIVTDYADDVKNTDYSNINNDELSEEAKKLRSKTHKAIKKCSEDFVERYHYNTGIAMLMELVNEQYQFKPKSDIDYKVLKESFVSLIRCLFPVSPHIAEELHKEIGFDGSIYDYDWPSYIEGLTKDDTVEYVFQVNGKIRGKVQMPVGLKKEELEKLALENDHVKKYTEGKDIKRIIVVPNKLVNIVAK